MVWDGEMEWHGAQELVSMEKSVRMRRKLNQASYLVSWLLNKLKFLSVVNLRHA